MSEESRDRLIVAPAGEADLAWAADRFGIDCWPGGTLGIAVTKGCIHKCVIIYTHFFGRGCMTHIVSDGGRDWASRGVLYAMCAYPFIGLGLDHVMGLTPASNIQALVFNLKLGWEIEGRLRGTAEDGGDEIMFMMRRDRCRWISEELRDGR